LALAVTGGRIRLRRCSGGHARAGLIDHDQSRCRGNGDHGWMATEVDHRRIGMRITGFWYAVMLLACAALPARAADAERGRALYEARCDLCHGSSVHVREARKATTFDGLRRQVARWNAEIGGGTWSREEIDDVTVYLNNRYYFFSCPESVCGSGRAKAGLERATAIVKK
jgi:hypothetical protein